MYTKCTEASIKEYIINQFSKPESTLRVIIGTIAFGMGPDVRQVLHIESYIQETRRCGRDGFTSSAIVFHAKADERYTSPKMVEYCNNDKLCLREILFLISLVSLVFVVIFVGSCDCKLSGFSSCLVTYAFSHFLLLMDTPFTPYS